MLEINGNARSMSKVGGWADQTTLGLDWVTSIPGPKRLNPALAFNLN